MRGLSIDLSSHNGEWDPTLMDPRISLVIHKATEGTTFQDPNYQSNRFKCPSNVQWAAYHLLRETSAIETQIDNFLITSLLDEGDLCALDLETRWIKAMVDKWGQQKTRDNINYWLSAVAISLDRKPLVYISERGVKALGYKLKDFNPQWPVWWVEYKTPSHVSKAYQGKLNPKIKEWELWQITSGMDPSFGAVSSSSVDVNIIRDISFINNNDKRWRYDKDLDFFLPPE